jgi:hypothetical protein
MRRSQRARLPAAPGSNVTPFESQLTKNLFEPRDLYLAQPEARAERGDPLTKRRLVAYPLDHEVSGNRHLIRQRREVHRHPDVVARILEVLREEACAEVGWPHRRPDVPGAGNIVRLHLFDGGGDLPFRLFPGQVGVRHAVEVVDGGLPMAQSIRPSSRTSAPAVRPNAIRNSIPSSSMARALSTPRRLFRKEGVVPGPVEWRRRRALAHVLHDRWIPASTGITDEKDPTCARSRKARPHRLTRKKT